MFSRIYKAPCGHVVVLLMPDWLLLKDTLFFLTILYCFQMFFHLTAEVTVWLQRINRRIRRGICECYWVNANQGVCVCLYVADLQVYSLIK